MNDFGKTIRRRIEAVSEPVFDFSAIRRKAEEKWTLPVRRRNAIAAVVLIIAAPLLVAAAAHFIPLNVTHRFGNWQLYGPGRGETLMHPSQTDFARLAREAPYPVIWPSGIPHDDKATMLASVGSEVFIIVYSCTGRDPSHVWSSAVIIPKDYSAVNARLGKWFTDQLQDHRSNVLWDVGNESVLFGSDCLTDAQVARVRAETRLRR